jgi:twitching motility protein PilJ
MKLRSKVILILGLGIVSLSAAFYTLSRLFVLNSYASIEEQLVEGNVQRALDALSADLEGLALQVLDYSKWTESYDFIAGKNPGYIESNFSDFYIADLGLNAIIFVNEAGKIVFAQGADLATSREVPVSPALLAQLEPASPMLDHRQPDSSTMGIVRLPEGPMLVASRPIVTNEDKGPIRGTVLMGQYLNEAILQDLRDLTGLPQLDIVPFDRMSSSPVVQQVKRDLLSAIAAIPSSVDSSTDNPEMAMTSGGASTTDVRPLNGESIAGFSLLNDLNGNPTFLLQVEQPRLIYAQGQRSLQWLLFSMLASGGVLGAIALLLLDRSILSRLSRLTLAVSQIGTKRDVSQRVVVSGTDELSRFALLLNGTLDRLEHSQSLLRQNANQLQRQNKVLADLSQNEALLRGKAAQSAKAFTKAAADTLGIDRVSIWLLNGDRTRLTCLDRYDRNTQIHAAMMELRASESPAYFETLVRRLPIALDDVQSSAKALALPQSHLIPFDVRSVLEIPIQRAGQPLGVVRCERLKTSKPWQPGDRSFVNSIANLVALALESETLQEDVDRLLDVVSSIEEGDLRVKARVSDRATGLVADTLNRSVEELARVLSQVTDTVQQVSGGTRDLRDVASTVAANTDRQAQSVVQVSALSEQVELTAHNTAEKVNATTQSLMAVGQAVEQGRAAIAALTDGIDRLHQGANQIVQRMKALGEFVGLADEFVQDQSQIASLTQVLAMNAALVAARAAEQRDPQQFHVVAREFEAIADQVSQLAQQADGGLGALQQRTHYIRTVVATIDAEVQRLGGLVSGFTHGVRQTSQVCANVEAVAAEAVRTGQSVAQSNRDIVTAAQTSNRAIQDIAAFAERTAALTQHMQLQSEAMRQLTEELLGSVQFFQLPATSQPPALESSASAPRLDLSQTAIERTLFVTPANPALAPPAQPWPDLADFERPSPSTERD